VAGAPQTARKKMPSTPVGMTDFLGPAGSKNFLKN